MSRDLGWAWRERHSNEPRPRTFNSAGKRKKRKLSKSVRKWMALRAAVFRRYGHRCMKCGSVENLEVDHIKPRSKFPKLAWDFDNLQILCRPCNVEKWNYHSTDYREEFIAQELDRELLAAARERI